MHGELQLNPLELAHKLVSLASDFQAEDIVLLDITEIFPFADYFVILSVNSDRQAKAIQEEMISSLKKQKIKVYGIEGTTGSGWQLLDFKDVVVHIFSVGKRETYNLEELWVDAPRIVSVQ